VGKSDKNRPQRSDLAVTARDDSAAAKDRPNRIEALTGLRFLAAASILVSHTSTWTAPFTSANPISGAAEMIGIYGMPLFFVLSGFVIHYNYARLFREWSWRAATAEFFIARFARLYPLYFFFVIVGLISDFTVNWIHDYLADFVKLVFTSLTLTQSWFYIIVVNHKILLENAFGLGWSVSTEWFFYCVYIVLVFAVFRLRRPSIALAAIAGFSLSAFLLLGYAEIHSTRIVDLARRYVTDDPALTSQAYGFHRWLFYYSPYIRVLEFVLGCLTAQLYMLLTDRPVDPLERTLGSIALWIALPILLLIGIFHVTSTSSTLLDHYIRFFALNFGCAIPLATVLFCVSRYDSPVRRLLAGRSLVGLGEISYSIYAVHTWTLRAFLRPAVDFNFANGAEALIRIPLAMIFSTIMATATYRLIEMPCRRYVRSKWSRQLQTWRDRQLRQSRAPAGLI
jgi:peptidoglycan/LPS O-acetylase OafA/YrhL